MLTRYLAKGLKYGKITGFDISKNLVDYGNGRIRDEKLTEVCQLEEADGFELPYENGTFDAVTNYTYLGVLSDPLAGLKELIRVCKPGGTVSAVIASNSFPRIECKGEYPFKESQRLDELYKKQDEIYHKVFDSSSMYHQGQEWDAEHYPKMFDICGLKDIHIYPFAIGYSYSDSRWPLEYRKLMVDDGINDELRIIGERSLIEEFEDHGFTRSYFNELIELLKVKRNYLLENLETDRSYEWNAALNIVVTGKAG
jgi:ubiquinone/menaquinone biosynthesis C-methylase UbiE